MQFMQILMRKLVALMCFYTGLVQAQFQDIDTVAEDLIFLTEKFKAIFKESVVFFERFKTPSFIAK